MSPDRQSASVARHRLTAEQEPFLVARSLSTTYSGGSRLHPHRHASHQLLFASTGAMTVTGDETTWMIPPGRAVLIPAGGMPFGLWRQKARLLESVRLLVQGGSVTDAALDPGYSSVSAYIAAFKQTFGYTPGTMIE